MAVLSFSDLHTESGLKTLEAYLSGKTFISGYIKISCLLIIGWRDLFWF